MKPPLFVLGCPRSGTTFLSGLLRPSTYGAPFESQFIIKFYKRLPRYEPLARQDNLVALTRAILRERAIRQRRVELDPEAVFESVPAKTYRALIDTICFDISRRRKEDVLSWGDKTPGYTLDFEVILELFPDARFLHIMRDGRDVALSLMKKSWGPSNVFSCARLWQSFVLKKALIQELCAPDQILFLRYEDLLTDPEAGIRTIFGFLGEKCPEPELKALIEGTRSDNFGKWKKQMTKAEQRVFEAVAAKSLEEEGYDVLYQPSEVGPIRVLYYRTGDLLKRIRHLLKINLLDSLAIRLLGKEPFAE